MYHLKNDSISKHINGEQHKLALDLKKSELGAIPYQQSVIRDTPIDRGIKKMSERDKKFLRVKFNCTYYLLKQERPFADYPELLKLHVKNQGTSYKTDRA